MTPTWIMDVDGCSSQNNTHCSRLEWTMDERIKHSSTPLGTQESRSAKGVTGSSGARRLDWLTGLYWTEVGCQGFFFLGPVVSSIQVPEFRRGADRLHCCPFLLVFHWSITEGTRKGTKLSPRGTHESASMANQKAAGTRRGHSQSAREHGLPTANQRL